MSINDTLKFKSYGWKKDYESKVDHIDKVLGEHRQYYPPDAHGVIDEWSALIKNQAEVYQQDERLRKENEYLAREQYKQDLDRQMKEKQFREQAELAKRRNEGDLIQNQSGLAYQLGQQIRNIDKAEKDRNYDDYLNATNENRRKALEAKERDRMEDQNMIAMNRFANRNSQRASKDKNNLYKADLDNVADYHNYIKNQLGEDLKRKEDEDYLLACQRANEKRDKEREDWYNKYKKFSDDMDKRAKTTLAQAQPTLARQKHIDDKIQADYDKYGEKLFSEYDKNRQEMDAKWRNADNENMRNLKDKTRATQMSKIKDKEDLEMKLREAMAYNQNEEKKRRDMDDQKNLYKETLQNQMTLNALGKYNYGKMTLQEKHLNKADLRAFKNKDRNGTQALIPGINNLQSIGTKPLMRGAMNVMDFTDSPPQGPKGRKGQMFFSPEPVRPQGFIGKPNFQHPLPNESTIRRSPNSTFNNRAGTPESTIQRNPISQTEFERYKTNSRNHGPVGFNTARNHTQSVASLYNPIVNPIDKSYKLYGNN